MGAPSVWSVVLFTSQPLPFKCFRGPPETPLGKAKGEEESPWEAGSVHMLQKYKTKQNKKQKTLSLFLLLSPILPEPTGCCHHCCSPYFSSFSFSSSSSSFLCVQRPEIDIKCLLQWLTSSSGQNLGEHGAHWPQTVQGVHVPHPSFVSASWVLGLQADHAIYLAIMWALSILRLAEQTISPQDHQQILQRNRERGCTLLLMVYYGRNLGIKDAPWKRWPQYSSDSQLHCQGMRPLGKDTQPWSPYWLDVSLLVQLMKTENLCLHRYTLSCELWYSGDAGQPKQSPLCLLLRDISPRREIWPLSKWNENLVFYMWKPTKQEISTISHKMNLNTIDDILY